MALKYIIVKNGCLELLIIFDEILNHSDVAGRKEVVSAGFCNYGRTLGSAEESWKCWGKSVTLKIESRECDSQILNSSMNRY